MVLLSGRAISGLSARITGAPRPYPSTVFAPSTDSTARTMSSAERCFRQTPKAHFRITKLTLDHSKRMFNLGPDLRFRIFDLAAQAADQTLFRVLFIAAGPGGYRPDHLAILMLRTLVHTSVTRIAAHVSFLAVQQLINRVRSINPTYPALGERVTVASLANSSTAAALRSPLPTAHGVIAQVLGAATYRAPGR